MKTITKLLLIFTTAVSLAGCDEFLNQPPIGGSLIQEQYDQLGNKLEGSMRGVYSMMYAVSSTENFGQRSIDMVISTVKTQTTFWDNLNKYGMPTDGLNVLDESGNVIYHYNEQDSLSAIYYAQALTMRGYVYSSLVRFFVPTVDHLFNGGYNLTNYPCFPVYTEANMNDGAQPLAMLNEVYTLIDQDLTSAISVFDAFGKEYCYRYGGDEFLVMVPALSQADFEKKLAYIMCHKPQIGAEYEVHFAAGYVHDTPADTEMLHKMIAEADKKMYAQKRAYAQ